MQLKPINQQVVAVVGASSGIGRETALRFAKKGAKVVVSARSQPGLESLVDEIRREGGEATAIAADVSNFEQVKAMGDKPPLALAQTRQWSNTGDSILGYITLRWNCMPTLSRQRRRNSSA